MTELRSFIADRPFNVAFPVPIPTVPSPSPTTTRAEKEKRLPPLTTFATLFMYTTLSLRFNPSESILATIPPYNSNRSSVISYQIQVIGNQKPVKIQVLPPWLHLPML